MADNSNTSDSDSANLTEPNNLRISRNAATQTPEMPRHAIAATASDATSSIATQQPPSSSSFVVLRVDNTKDLSDFEKEAKALAIPDVVVEYIKDSCALTGKNEDNDSDHDFGASNLGFESSESISRVPSQTSLRDYQKSGSLSHAGSINQLNAKYFYDDNSESDVGLLPVVGQNRRMYHSMPRNMAKKYLLEDFRIHSQPASPRLPRMKTSEHLDECNSNFSLYPAPNGIGFVAPPSPNFGYRPLESETSAVYTIIKLDTNDLKGVHFLPSIADSMKSTPRVKRKFEFAPAPPAVERKIRRLQCVTDACSLMFFLPGLLLALLTPIFIIPMFMYPISYFLQLALIFVASGAVSACILFFSGFIGNMVWYYDDKSERLRLKLHCGTGPMRHYWGNIFYHWSDKAREKKMKEEMIV